VLVGMVGSVYLFSSLLLNAGFMYHAWKLKFSPEPNSAMETFKFSIYHLLALFVALLADHYISLLFTL
jgi:protoheme IX farnesyltransferase